MLRDPRGWDGALLCSNRTSDNHPPKKNYSESGYCQETNPCRRGGRGYLDHAEVGGAAIARLDEAHVPRDHVLGVDHLALAAADHRGLGGEHPLDRRGCLLGAPLLHEACGGGQQGCIRPPRGASLCGRHRAVVKCSERGLPLCETVRVRGRRGGRGGPIVTLMMTTPPMRVTSAHSWRRAAYPTHASQNCSCRNQRMRAADGNNRGEGTCDD